jgi:metal-responsive CopG/Arc/MetJ family transcriptional regulator
MVDETETKFVGLTLPIKWLKQIDEKIKDKPMVKRQDYIRDLIRKDLGD